MVNRKSVGIEFIRVNQIDGIEFVEIENQYDIKESVLVNKIDIDVIDKQQPVQIYGTVMVWDGWSNTQIVYDRGYNNPESTLPGQCLSLTGPSMPVWADDPFLINLCLWFHDHHHHMIVNGEIEGDICWDPLVPMEPPPNDQLIQQQISGKYGSVTVGYSVITQALSVTIKVDMMIINRESPVPVAVYGTIKAVSTFHNDESITRLLFDKSENEYIEVSPQQQQSIIIPLIRPIFPIGDDSYLTITADLWDHDSLSPDNQIALGSVEFDPIIGTQNQNITGKYGELQISFTCV